MRSWKYALKALGINTTKPPELGIPLGNTRESAKWSSCSGNSVLIVKGRPFDIEYFTSKDNTGFLQVQDKFTIPKQAKRVSFDEALKLNAPR